jgi:hypothetical protein
MLISNRSHKTVPFAIYIVCSLVVSLLFLALSGCDSQEASPFLNGNYEAVSFTGTTADGKTVDLLTEESTIQFSFASPTNRVDAILAVPMAVPTRSSRAAVRTDTTTDIWLTGRFAQDGERVRFHDLTFRGGISDVLHRLFVYGDWRYDSGTIRGTSEEFSLTLKPMDRRFMP